MSLKERNTLLKQLRSAGHIIPRNIKLPELREMMQRLREEHVEAVSGEGEQQQEELQPERPKRPERVPLGTHRPKLDFESYKKPGYSYRLMRGSVGRLQDAERGGWEYVLAEDGTKVKARVGEFEDGSSREDFLMKIDKKWYDEDQAKKQKVVDQVDEAIKAGGVGRQTDDGRYVPDGAIRYETTKT